MTNVNDNNQEQLKGSSTMFDNEMFETVVTKILLHEPMTLEEVAFALWVHEGAKPGTKPLSKVQILHIERNALAKARSAMEKFGIHGSEDACFNSDDKNTLASMPIVK